MVTTDESYLGFDFSTQRLKAVIINKKQTILCDATVEFDSDLPEFRTHKGVIRSPKHVVTAPALMWVKALDIILDKLRICGADFSKIVALSGCAQQHGTVYWSSGAEDILKSLTPAEFLHTQLASSFTIKNSPVWMDASTKAECRALENAVGGPIELAKITGSKAYERYSAVQICKIWNQKPTAYRNTERISLISSFACSLFLGKYAPIDFADGSGMNLLDISTKSWSQICLEATAPDLEAKLGTPVPSSECLGTISNYFCERFGFNEDCKIFAFTGDNPSSLAGMCLGCQDIGISLGTSDTLFIWLKEAKLLTEGHILVNPVTSDEYMALICYKNGSLIRERYNKLYTDGSWEEFNKLLDSTPRGNFGYMGLYFDVKEITPNLEGTYRYDRAGNLIDKFPSPEIEIRALIEGQFLAKRAMIDYLNVPIGESTKIIVTGGASGNTAILQVISDVFGGNVYQMDYANSAVLGASFRATDCLHLLHEESLKSHSNLTLTCKPYQDCDQIYTPMLIRYKEIVANLLSNQD